MLCFNFNIQLIGFSSFWQGNLNLDIKHTLRPIILLSWVAIISADFFHFICKFRFLRLFLRLRLRLFGSFSLFRGFCFLLFSRFFWFLQFFRLLLSRRFTFLFWFSFHLLSWWVSFSRFLLFFLLLSELFPPFFKLRLVWEPLIVLILISLKVRVDLMLKITCQNDLEIAQIFEFYLPLILRLLEGIPFYHPD
jgi:hypothetical protein